mgnify:FL=1
MMIKSIPVWDVVNVWGHVALSARTGGIRADRNANKIKNREHIVQYLIILLTIIRHARTHITHFRVLKNDLQHRFNRWSSVARIVAFYSKTLIMMLSVLGGKLLFVFLY